MPDDSHRDEVKDAALLALRRLLDPLFDVMFDSGITVGELTRLIRDGAVHAASRRVRKESGQWSKSRVAIMTGLPRSEVARSLKLADARGGAPQRDHHPGRRVLAAWHDTPAFLTPGGAPAVLPIYGDGASFESLVNAHGSALPVRAMLDELVHGNAIECLPGQTVRATSRIPRPTRLTASALGSLGERGKDLLTTLTTHLRQGTEPRFQATAQLDAAGVVDAATLHRALAEHGHTLITAAESLLQRRRVAPTADRAEGATTRLGITVYCFQEDRPDVTAAVEAHVPRKNLRRRPERKKTTPRRAAAQLDAAKLL